MSKVYHEYNYEWITSCGGTLKARMRISTLFIRSTRGIVNMSPKYRDDKIKSLVFFAILRLLETKYIIKWYKVFGSEFTLSINHQSLSLGSAVSTFTRNVFRTLPNIFQQFSILAKSPIMFERILNTPLLGGCVLKQDL